MTRSPKISKLTHEFLEAAKPELLEVEIVLQKVRDRMKDASFDLHSPERQIEHLVGGFLSAIAGVKDLEAFDGGGDSRLSFVKESLDLYLDARFDEKKVLEAVEEKKINADENPIPAMRRMQKLLSENFAL